MIEWKIGPTFAAEIAAAGISFDGWAWNAWTGALSFADGVMQQQRDAVAAVLAAHDPAAQTDPPTVPYPIYPKPEDPS